MQKAEIRKYIREIKRQFNTFELAEQSETVISRLKASPKFRNANVIMLYYSLDDEVCTHDLIDELARQGKTVCLPKVLANGEMELRTYHSRKDLAEGAFHIMEPTGSRFTDYDSIDIAVIPGMAFDKEGHRLGRGKGYYDRFLSQLPPIHKAGICFNFQKLPIIPSEAHDVKMDEVI